MAALRGMKARERRVTGTLTPLVLSGELGSNNSMHVITANGVDATAILDGFTITGGASDATDPEIIGYQTGGGVYLASSSPVLTNLSIQNNSATSFGGGMYFEGSSPVLTNLAIQNNSAIPYGRGGGIAF